MFLRSTNNSLAVGLDATSLPSQSEDLPPSTSANAKVLCPSCSDAHSPLPQASRQDDVPSPAFLAWVVAAVKQALAADQTPTSVEASSSVAGGIPMTFLSSTIICRLWNRGQCVAPLALCHFGHKCQSCFGHHRVKDCPGIRPANSMLSPNSLQPLLHILAASLGDCFLAIS